MLALTIKKATDSRIQVAKNNLNYKLSCTYLYCYAYNYPFVSRSRVTSDVTCMHLIAGLLPIAVN